jgi:hypothetical protein
MPLNPDTARTVLGWIRLVNGLGGLLVPRAMARRFGVDTTTGSGTVYVLRLFGVRTVLLGLQLLLPAQPDDRRLALQSGVLIHASDTMAALIAGLKKQLPGRAAVAGTLISATNTAFAVVALRASRRTAPGSRLARAS